MRSFIRFRSTALLAIASIVAPSTSPAQRPPTLADALAEADRHAFANRRAQATANEARARAVLPLRALVPTARVESGLLRTTDPIGAFGATLRQRAVTPAAFDPARLNDPAAVSTIATGIVVDVPLVNTDAWAARRAARAAADALKASTAWTATTVHAQVVRAWFGIALADARTMALADAQAAADATVRQVGALVRQGLVTHADELQARVHAGDMAAATLAARLDVQNARRQLGLLLGRDDGEPLAVSAVLPADSVLRRLATDDTSSAGTFTTSAARAERERSDVQMATLGAEAARYDARRAYAGWMPRLNGFARQDWFAATTPLGAKPNWTIGVMGSWSLLANPAERADAAMATARARAASADSAATLAAARLDVRVARSALQLALQRLDLAALAAREATEAQRLVAKRYLGGLATIAERLGADATATNATVGHAAAIYALVDALVEWRRASGADPSVLAVLDAPRISTGDNR